MEAILSRRDELNTMYDLKKMRVVLLGLYYQFFMVPRNSLTTSSRVTSPVFTGIYRQVSNISRTLIGNKIVDNSDVVGASPVGAAPTTPSLSTLHLASADWAQTTARLDENDLSFDIRCVLY